MKDFGRISGSGRRERQDELLMWWGQMLGVIAAMSPSQRKKFREWDQTRSPGVATSDWSGFEKYIGKPPWFGEQPKAPNTPRARFKKQIVPVPLRWQVWQRDGFKCKHCGSQLFLSVDHVIPESKGGLTTLNNLQTLCSDCNCKKGNRHTT